MNQHEKYVIDANVLIEAHQRYYAFDIAPSFWERLIQNAALGKIVSIDHVKRELTSSREDDDLSIWSKELFSDWFIQTEDEAVYVAYARVIDWVTNNEQFHEAAVSEFASVADSWLIAYALAYDYTIVTHEAFNAHAKKRILIPNVCKEFGIPYVNTFQMMRNMQLVLG